MPNNCYFLLCVITVIMHTLYLPKQKEFLHFIQISTTLWSACFAVKANKLERYIAVTSKKEKKRFSCLALRIGSFGLHQRWAGSEKLTSKPNPDPKSKTPDPKLHNLQILDSGSSRCPSLMLLVHSIYTVPVHEQQTCKPIN